MKKLYMVYLLIVFGICAGGVLVSQGKLQWLWDVPTFVFTPGIALVLMLGHYSPREMIDAFRCAGVAERSEPELKKSLLFFDTLHRLLIISGLFAFTLGLLLVMAYDDPSEGIFNKFIGRYMAVCTLSVLYLLFLIMTITVPFQSALRKKLIK